jgi:hypothetical protein
MGDSPAYVIYVPTFRNTLSVPYFGCFPSVWISCADLSEHYQFHLHKRCKHTTYEDGTDSVSKGRHINFRHWGITQNKELTECFETSAHKIQRKCRKLQKKRNLQCSETSEHKILRCRESPKIRNWQSISKRRYLKFRRREITPKIRIQHLSIIISASLITHIFDIINLRNFRTWRWAGSCWHIPTHAVCSYQ